MGPPDESAPPPRLGAAMVVLALTPFPLVVWSTHGLRAGYDLETVVFPVDLGLALLLVAAGGATVRRMRRRGGPAGARLLGLLTTVLGLAWLAHPSGRGAHLLLELAGVTALAAVIEELWPGRFGDALPLAVGALAGLETVWSAAQLATGHALGLSVLGEHTDPFQSVGGGLAPFGSLVHCYLLAGLALVATGVLVARAVASARPKRELTRLLLNMKIMKVSAHMK